jgi:hypothetical protein
MNATSLAVCVQPGAGVIVGASCAWPTATGAPSSRSVCRVRSSSAGSITQIPCRHGHAQLSPPQMPDIRLQAQPFVHFTDRSIAGVGGGVHIRGLGLAVRRWLIARRQLVKELPGVCPIELAYLHSRYEVRIKAPQVDTMLGAWLEFDRLPMRDTPAGSAADRSQGPIALDVLGGVLRVSVDLDCAELEVDPRPSDPTAQRAVAGSCHCGRGRQFQFDSAAVAGTFVHGSSYLNNAGDARW